MINVDEHINNEHYYNLISIFDNINENIKSILDAGSGKSSLNVLISYYNTNIDAIIYPGDTRKKESIINNINGNYNLIELDICTNQIKKEYDLVLAHLLLGEALKWNNKFQVLLDNLLNIKSRYYIIYDFLEDPSIDYAYLENYLNINNYKIILKREFRKQEEQIFQDFVGKNYVCYLIRK